MINMCQMSHMTLSIQIVSTQLVCEHLEVQFLRVQVWSPLTRTADWTFHPLFTFILSFLPILWRIQRYRAWTVDNGHFSSLLHDFQIGFGWK